MDLYIITSLRAKDKQKAEIVQAIKYSLIFKRSKIEWAGNIWKTKNSTAKTVLGTILIRKGQVVDQSNGGWMQ